MVDVSTGNNTTNVEIKRTDITTGASVTSAGTAVAASATNNSAEYYSSLAKAWAISEEIVQRTDYSSKHYAQESKSAYETTKATADTVITNINTLTTNFETLANTQSEALSDQYTTYSDNLTNAQSNALTAITTAQTTAQTAISTDQAAAQTAIKADKDTALSDISTAKTNFDTNAESLLSEYNTNAADKLTVYNDNDTTKTDAYNANAAAKETALNDLANSLTDDYNANAAEKETSLNTLADTLQTEITSTGTTTQETINTTAQTAIDNINSVAEEKLIDGVVYYEGYEEGENGEITILDMNWGNIKGTLSDQTDLQAALDLKANKTDIPTVPANVSAFTNDAGYLTEHQDISGKADKSTTLAGYGITDAYTKTELDSKGYLTSYTETDPVYTADKPNLALKSDIPDVSGYALKSGIPTKTSQLTNDSNFIINGGDIKTDYVTVTYGVNDYGAYIETDTARICLCQNQGLVADYDNDALLSVFEVDNPLIRLSNNVAYTVVDSGNISTYLTNYATTSYVDDKIGDISTALDTINGESV